MEDFPIKKVKKITICAIPKTVMAEAVGVPRKQLNDWIEDENLFEINRKNYFKPNEVRILINYCGGADNIRYEVIEQYLSSIERKKF